MGEELLVITGRFPTSYIPGCTWPWPGSRCGWSYPYADWLLVVVSGFILAVVALIFVLARVGSHDPGAGKSKVMKEAKFRDWAGGEFSTWQDHVRGKNAAIEILLPLAAVAFGMPAIAIVYLGVYGPG